MTKVAAEYGISDVGLKKICGKHRVPVPGRGYWAKKAAGKPVKRRYFTTVDDPLVERIVIHGNGARNLPSKVEAAQQKARKHERKPENKIEVLEAPEDLHPKVGQTVSKLEKAKTSETGLLATLAPRLFDVTVGPESIVRVATFLHALVTGAEERGYQIIKGDRSLVFVVDEERLDFKIIEETKRSKHEQTEAELAELRKRERRQQRNRNTWEYASWTPRPRAPEWDYAPSGYLQVVINEDRYARDGLRRSFGDGKKQRIEFLINAILEAFATWSAAIKAKREQDERRRLEWEAERERQEIERQRRVLENKRIEALTSDFGRWRDHCLLLDYIAAIEAKLNRTSCSDPEAVKEWLSWARAYADSLNPLNDSLPRLLQPEDFSVWELSH